MSKKLRNVKEIVIHINSGQNNTIITATDKQGNTILARSSGSSNFKGSAKSTPYAGESAARMLMQDLKKFCDIESITIECDGPGITKEATSRVFADLAPTLSIRDNVGIPHNGCRPRSPRRV
jgi:small subunit ribosomal protein S11